ncbi:hypothetical protein [Klebsiella aerogenes]|uniref:hypothetical protein n=1 Tax=Klebsiella aerogenes TaxID=548 RepID=UPI001BD0F76B|nr:hypothetical protein [Klebsiella aerogenes]
MLIISVLKTSKEFTPKHAQWLHKQLKGHPSVCLTDAGTISGVNTVPLLHGLPGWWSKLELFNPEHPDIGQEDLLYIDIDTVVTGDISPLFELDKMTMLSDFGSANPHEAPLASGLMYIPAAEKYKAWNAFWCNPEKIMTRPRIPPFHGDQGFLSEIYPDAQRFQVLFANQILSYKADIATEQMYGHDPDIFRGDNSGVLPEEARIVCFHGFPRPWKTGLKWIPRLSILQTAKTGFRKAKKYCLRSAKPSDKSTYTTNA